MTNTPTIDSVISDLRRKGVLLDKHKDVFKNENSKKFNSESFKKILK